MGVGMDVVRRKGGGTTGMGVAEGGDDIIVGPAEDIVEAGRGLTGAELEFDGNEEGARRGRSGGLGRPGSDVEKGWRPPLPATAPMPPFLLTAPTPAVALPFASPTPAAPLPFLFAVNLKIRIGCRPSSSSTTSRSAKAAVLLHCRAHSRSCWASRGRQPLGP